MLRLRPVYLAAANSDIMQAASNMATNVVSENCPGVNDTVSPLRELTVYILKHILN